MKNFLIIASLFVATLTFAQPILHTEKHLAEPDDAPYEHVLNIEREKVEVSFEPKQALVKGKVTYYFVVLRENVDSIYFNAIKIRIKEAKLGGKPVPARPVAEYAKALKAETLKTQGDVLVLAARLEFGATNAYLGVIPSFKDEALAKVAGRLAADETMHWTVLNGALARALPQNALTFGA